MSFIQWEMRTKIILAGQGIELTVFLLVEKMHKQLIQSNVLWKCEDSAAEPQKMAVFTGPQVVSFTWLIYLKPLYGLYVKG